MTLTKLINDKRLSAFVIAIGALVATTLAAVELADQSPLSFLSVAAFMWFVYFACRIFEWCDSDNVRAPSFANHAGAIAPRNWLARIGMRSFARCVPHPRTGSLCAVACGSSADEIQQAGSFWLAGVFFAGRVRQSRSSAHSIRARQAFHVGMPAEEHEAVAPTFR